MEEKEIEIERKREMEKKREREAWKRKTAEKRAGEGQVADAMRNRRTFAERKRTWVKRARRKSARV